MNQVQKISAWSFFFSMFLALWGAIYPVPYKLCMAALLLTPMVAIAAIALSKGRLAAMGDGKQITLLFVFLYTMGASAYRAYHDVQLLSRGRAVLYAFVVAIVMELMLVAVDKSFRSIWILVIVLPFITFTYGIGLVLESDMLLDRAVPQKFVTRVLRRDIHYGSRYKTYDVTLAPWGGQSEATVDLVTRSVYYSLSPGGNACMSLAPGALQIPWYTLEACSSTSAVSER